MFVELKFRVNGLGGIRRRHTYPLGGVAFGSKPLAARDINLDSTAQRGVRVRF